MGGDLGIEYVRVGAVIQSLASVLVDRGYDVEDVKRRLIEWAGTGNESDWWERWGGPAIDELAYALGFDSAFPEDE